MTEKHISGLGKLCRVCGSKIAKGKCNRRYSCIKFASDLNETLSIDVSPDEPHTHPSHFCQICKSAIYNKRKKGVKEGNKIDTYVRVHNWKDHSDDVCEVCEPPPHKGGRPKKPGRGRPSIKSAKSAAKYIRLIAPAQLTNTEEITVTNLDSDSDFQCVICMSLLDQPIELSTCSNFVCAKCCCQWLATCDSLSCPSDHKNDYHNSVRCPQDIILTALGNVNVTCNKCKRKMLQKDHVAHICTIHLNEPESVSEILKKSKDSPLSPTEEKLQSSLVRRSLSNSGTPGRNLQVKTGGQVKQTLLETVLILIVAHYLDTYEDATSSQ